MPAPLNPGNGPGGIGPGAEQPTGGTSPLGRFRIWKLFSNPIGSLHSHRVSQVAVETIVQKASTARASQVAVEVLIASHHNGLVTQVAIEVLMSAARVPQNPAINHQNPAFV